MSKTPAQIREALALKIKDELAVSSVLLRMIAEYDGWMIPNSFMNVGDPPIQYALMFTDEDAYKVAQNQFGDQNVPDEYLLLPGSKVLAMLAGSVDSISINPCAPESIAFPKQLLPELVKLGEAIEIERALSRVLQDNKGWKLIKDYEGYIVPVGEVTAGQFAPLSAPDSRGRNLLPVFTCTDTLNAYVIEQHGGKPVDVTLYKGANLCKWIVESDCDGVVFNCSGPSRPNAFAKEFAKEVLDNAERE